VALLVSLAALVTVLLSSYSLKLWSDPVQWYCFGRDFPAQFGKAKLAYGFPLLLYLAIKAVGPLPALLVNIPVLVLMALMLAAFTRSVFRGSCQEIRILAPAAAIWMLLVVDGKMLATLVSPYRDPLSFVFLLGSLLLFRRGMVQPARRGYALLSGMALALAASTRETSVLAMPAMLISAAFCKEIRFSILLKWFLWWGVGFVAASLPYLYQNTLVSGYPWIPAQAARTLDENFSLVPGVSPSFLGETLPRAVGYLLRHYSWIGVLMGGIGTLLLWRRERRALVLIICLFVIYLIFYGSYVHPVERYLMVLDLFVLPLMAGGVVRVAGAVILSVRRLHPYRAPVPTVLAFILCLALAATSVPAVQRARSKHRFRLQDARRLQTLLQRYIPPDASLVSGRYFGEVAMCLLTNPVIVTDFIAPSHTSWHFNLPRILSAGLHDRPTVMAALTSSSLDEMLAGDYDLRPVTTVDLDRQRLSLPLERQQIPLVELLPWSNRVVSLKVENRPPPACLEVNLGRVSRLPRTRLVLELDGCLLDTNPSDYLNYYRIDSTNTTLRLTVRSDSPLPAGIRAEVHPFPLIMPTAFHGLRKLEGILSAAMRRYPQWKYAAVCDTAGLRLPALGRNEEYLLVSLVVGVPSWVRPLRPQLSISLASNTLLCADLSPAPDRRGPWGELSFAVPPLSATSAMHTHLPLTLVLSTDGTCADDKPTCVFLKRMEVMPASECPPEIDIGGPGDNLWLTRGFYDRESAVSGKEQCSWRWTSHKADILILTRRPRTALSIEIDELAELRPGKDAPAFTFNGYPVAAVSQRRAGNGSRVVTHRLAVPAQVVTGRVNRLTISCPIWSPGIRVGSPDTRKLGIAVDRIRVRRADYDSRSVSAGPLPR